MFPYDFTYSDGTNNYNLTANASPFTIDVSPSATSNYTLVSVNDASCVGSVYGSATITVNPLPSLQLVGDNELCFGESVDLTFSLTGNAPFDITYSDGVTDFPVTGISASPYNVSISPNNSKTYTALTITDANCAGIANGSSDITVHQLPNVDAGSDQDICLGESTTLTGTNASTYIWDNEITNNVNFSPANTNTYSVTGTDSYGCQNTDNVDVIVNPLPIANAGQDQTICEGENATLTASGGSSYLWSNNETTASITVQPNNTTTYFVLVSNGTCSDTDSVKVFINTSDIELELNANTKNICQGDSILLNAVAQGGLGEPYIFTINGDVFTPPVWLSPSNTTVYQISTQDNCNSNTNQDIEITVFEAPDIQITADIYAGCEPLLVKFLNNNNCSDCSYMWQFDNTNTNNLSFNTEAIHTFEKSGVYDITLNINNSIGCKFEKTEHRMITVWDKPKAQFTCPNTRSILNPEVYFHNYSEGANNYQWNFGDGDSSFMNNPTHKYQSTNIFSVQLIAYSYLSCSDTTIQTVIIEQEKTFYAATAFSPDGDGINDVFKVFGTGIKNKGFSLNIFDRWGELIFTSNDINKGWDGKDFKQDYVQIGTYTWQCIFEDTNNIPRQKSGIVNLIR